MASPRPNNLPYPDYLESRIQRVTESGCWLWTGITNEKGYGRTSHSSIPKKLYAHRAVYELHKGPIPEGTCVCHKCDTPSCVNPEHMFLGTKADNNRDMRIKGRMAVGERSNSKLTEEMVKSIRADDRAQKTIAAEYGIHPSHVSDIKNGYRWAHVGDDK